MEPRSTFVTVIAWIFIVGSGFASLISTVQVIMVSTMFDDEAFRAMPDEAPAAMDFMFRNFHLFVYGFFLLVLFTFISSIGLLKRKNWARLGFIAVLGIGILWQVIGLMFQFLMFQDIPFPPSDDRLVDFERMSAIIQWVSVGIAIAISVLFAWLIRKLTTQPIIGEFFSDKSDGSDDVFASS